MKTQAAPDSPRPLRNRYTISIDGRVHTRLVTAPTEKAAVEVVYTRWGIERSQKVVATLKHRDPRGQEPPVSDTTQPCSTAAEGWAFVLGCILLKWTAALAEEHAGLEPQQRIQLEQGAATAQIKAAAWRALEAHGIPIDQLVAAAASYLEKHPESPQPSRYTWIIVGART